MADIDFILGAIKETKEKLNHAFIMACVAEPDNESNKFGIICRMCELSDHWALEGVYDAHCIAGYEVTNEVGHHLSLLWAVLIPDCVYVFVIACAMAFPDCNFGADPTTIGYNVIAGLVMESSLAKVSQIKSCGNAAMDVILTAPAAYGSIAGTLHFANAFVCFLFLARVERKFFLQSNPLSNPDMTIHT
uniref:Uncharacterized protein n=1 Tax=Glossina austeni TaxID=7395 RepID=A0A1A9VBW6_GLOAU